MARIKGTVMDPNGAVIVTPRPSLIFEGKNGARTAMANDSGDYEINLAAGIYKISSDTPGFYPFRRAQFRVLPASALIINVVLKPRYLTRGTTVSATESADDLAPVPKYEEFHVPRSVVSLLIQFQRKRKANGKIEYEEAVLTYDALTIYADKLSFNKARLQLNATGRRVVVEDGKQRVKVKRAAVSFKGGEPIVDLRR